MSEKVQDSGKAQFKGRELPYSMVKEIFRLRCQEPPPTYSDIARELGLDRRTVAKYCRQKVVNHKGIHVPTTPIDRQVETVNTHMMELANYNLEQSFLKSLGLIGIAKDHFIKLALEGNLPNVVTPLYIKQLVEAEKIAATMPGEIYKQRVDIYKQIAERDNEVSEAEYEEMCSWGDLDE